MNTQTVVYCVVALLLGMLLANMLTNVCGCKVVEGQGQLPIIWMSQIDASDKGICWDEHCPLGNNGRPGECQYLVGYGENRVGLYIGTNKGCTCPP